MGGCNWLVLLFTAQLVLFSCFMITFFSMETRRQEEQREMQKELHRLRTDNLAKERKLIKLAERAESWRFDRGGESEDDAGGELNEDEWSEESDEHPPGEDAYGAEALAPEEEALPSEKRAGCARLKEGWWVYEVCLGQHVRQFHAADAKAAFAENMLGMAPHACGAEEAGCHCMRLREDDAALSCHKAEEEYVRGDACPGRESTRSVTVKLVCREGEEAADSVLAEGALALVSVHEPETCRYEATVEAPAGLCGAAGGGGAAGGDGAAGGSEPLPAATVEEKRQAVVEALRHSWKGYEQYAWGKDELQPVSHKGKDWVGLGLTILDSLDVLWMANLTKEFAHGVEWVRDSLNYERPKPISVFETTIRCLGGMLAAYELSGEKVLLDRSIELGEKLQKAYGAAGLPYTTLSLLTGHKTIPNWTGGSLLLAEVGTVQMEFFALAHHAGKPEFRERAQRAIDLLDSQGGGLTDGGSDAAFSPPPP